MLYLINKRIPNNVKTTRVYHTRTRQRMTKNASNCVYKKSDVHDFKVI